MRIILILVVTLALLGCAPVSKDRLAAGECLIESEWFSGTKTIIGPCDAKKVYK